MPTLPLTLQILTRTATSSADVDIRVREAGDAYPPARIEGGLGYDITVSLADNDGDGTPDRLDPDDDNDGLSVVDEGTVGTDPYDPDHDDDLIRDGLDKSPLVMGNICTGDTATLNQPITGHEQCAAPVKVMIDLNTNVTNTGRLDVISPVTEFLPGSKAEGSGRVHVYSEDTPIPEL